MIWHVEDAPVTSSGIAIRDDKQNIVAVAKNAFVKGDALDRAALIVRAVNSHEALIEALKKIARDRGGNMGEYHADCQQIARAVLAATGAL